jgi:hypothetical protein
LSDGHAGLRIVRLLEAAQESIEQNGRVVHLKEVPPRRPVVPTLLGLDIHYAAGSDA